MRRAHGRDTRSENKVDEHTFGVWICLFTLLQLTCMYVCELWQIRVLCTSITLHASQNEGVACCARVCSECRPLSLHDKMLYLARRL